MGGSPRETLTAPSSFREVDGVTLPSSEHSSGKGTENLGEKQGESFKSLDLNGEKYEVGEIEDMMRGEIEDKMADFFSSFL